MMTNSVDHKKHQRKQGKTFWGNLWYSLTYNWGWKLICLLLAMLIWAALVSQDTTLTREKTFNNVEVSFNNAASMQRNGYIVIGGLENPVYTQVKAQVPQQNYEAAAASIYNVRVDLSSIRETGKVTVPILSSGTTAYGSVSELNPSSVTLTVDRYITRNRIPVTYVTTGESPAGLYTSSEITTDPSYVTVAGPESVISQIALCEATYDLSSLEGQGEGLKRIAVPFRLYDSTHQAVEASMVTVFANDVEVDTITIEQNIYLLVAQNLSKIGIVHGEPASGYEIKRITVSPESILIAVGEADAVVSDLAYLEGAVDVTGEKESLTAILPINRPNNVVSVSTDVAYVTVEIGPKEAAE